MGVGTVWSVDSFVGYEGMFPVADNLGCRVYVTSVDGWSRLDDPRVNRIDRPAANGTLSAKSTQPGRVITLAGTVKAPTQVALLMWIDRFTGLLTDDDQTETLTVQEAHLTRHIDVERGGEAVADPIPSTDWEGTFSVILYGPDPVRLGPLQTISTALPHTSGGLRYPVRYPKRYTAIADSGQIVMVNAGEISTPMNLRVDGPCAGPIISHRSSGAVLEFASNYNLAAGSWLDIDCDRRTVYENGTANRNGFVTERGFFRFDKGTNVIGFNAQTYNAASRLTAYGSSGW